MADVIIPETAGMHLPLGRWHTWFQWEQTARKTTYGQERTGVEPYAVFEPA